MAEPEIRFNGFEGEWETKKMSSILIPSKIKNLVTIYHFTVKK